MTFADSIIQSLGGLMGDANFGMTGTILIRSPNQDAYGNRIDEKHDTIDITGFFTEGYRGRKEVAPQGVEPVVAMTFFYTNDITTPISLADKFLYNGAYYNITLIVWFKAGQQMFQRKLSLQASRAEEVAAFGIV
jgi:hypothetical protein